MYSFCNGDLNTFFLLLRKGIYLYEYIDSWERFDEVDIDIDIDILDVDIDYPEKLFNLHKDLPFLPERKIVNKVEKLIFSTDEKENIHIRALR